MAIDAEVNAMDNQIPKASKHSDDSTMTQENDDLYSTSNTPCHVDSNALIQGDHVEGEHLDSTSTIEGEHGQTSTGVNGEHHTSNTTIEGEHHHTYPIIKGEKNDTAGEDDYMVSFVDIKFDLEEENIPDHMIMSSKSFKILNYKLSSLLQLRADVESQHNVFEIEIDVMLKAQELRLKDMMHRIDKSNEMRVKH
ncbi:unnamed protein product [Lactuca saligna]|uniref:Uncharacterized protein n=1 Tax=Lactuca saligna TaxID=75948 RepID=A0AA35Y4D3_LACSI|nr:unnamed protein product [Lactuca saligna]